MNSFDIKAADWDSNPIHRKISEAVAGKIKELLPPGKEMNALEYGSGTGVTSLFLKDCFKTITLMDSSSEMVRITNEKIRSHGLSNMKVVNFDLEQNDYNDNRFDFIFAQLVLHHIADCELILGRLTSLLKGEGVLVIADLFKEDGSFHGAGFTGHNGFDPENLAAILRKKNLRRISYSKFFTIDKKISDGETRKFDMFLLTAEF